MSDYKVSEAIGKLKIQTCEMHTCGGPVRIIEKGFPEVQGQTILEKVEYIKENLDYIRKFLVFEPRGHRDMFGVIRVEPDLPEADIAAIFFHNEGYCSMCGHVVISLGRYCIDKGLVRPGDQEETKVLIQCPCGLVPAYVSCKNGVTSRVRFHSVPAFVFAEDMKLKIENKGEISVDISYGGCFFVLIESHKLGIELKRENAGLAKKLGDQVLQAAKKTIKIEHPVHPGLSYLFGVVIYDATRLKDGHCGESDVTVTIIFANAQLDRSPCGSGSTSLSAYLFKKGLMKEGHEKIFQSAVTGSKFTAKVVESSMCGKFDAVTIEISGTGHYTGNNTFTAEASDPLCGGFLVNQ